MSAFTEPSIRLGSMRAATSCGTLNSGTIRNAGIPDSGTGPHSRSMRNTWNGSPQRELTTNTLSGKPGADQRAGGTTAGRSDRDPRPRDRDGSPRPGRPPAADPVNGIVTSKTAASRRPLRRRRRRSPAPGSTWHSGWRTRTTRPTPAPRSGQERTPPATGAR